MINKIINKIKSIFAFKKDSRVNCDHSNGISKKVKYCGDCLLVLDENNG